MVKRSGEYGVFLGVRIIRGVGIWCTSTGLSDREWGIREVLSS